ncbi:MAG: tripartite tricarboxylate transporter substrate-binding protein [Aestuariivirga sp.]
MLRRTFIGLAAALMMSTTAMAQNYPEKPITLVVAFAAGGPTDVIARIVSEHMSKTLGQQIVVENIAGAGGTTATAKVAGAAADGYTLIMGQMGTHAAAPSLYESLKYKPAEDFTPIGIAGITPILVVAKKDFPANSLTELVDYVKANPDKVNQANAGVGSTSFTTCILFKSIAGIPKINEVAYKGTGPALNDLVAGQVDFMCDQITNLAPQITAGNVKGLAIATAERSPTLPDVPTTKEAGLGDFQISGWNAIMAPKGLPADIQAKLADALNKALSDEATAKKLTDLGTVVPNAEERTPAGLAAVMQRDIKLLEGPLKASGITIK